MTDETKPNELPARTRLSWLPRLKSRWWTLLLGLSLMANLSVAGVLLGHRFGGGEERLAYASYVQLVPRSFFRDLSQERRKEIMQIVRERSRELRKLRETSTDTPLQLATALEKESFDAASVKAAVDAFTTGSGSLAAGGGQVVMEIVGMLTPEERKALAAAIRQRAENQARRKKK